MESNLAKGLVCVAGATTVGGGAVGAYLTLNSTKKEQSINTNTESKKDFIKPSISKTETNKKISDLLQGKRLLTTDEEDNSKWETQLNALKAKYKDKLPVPWEIPNWASIKEDPATIFIFKDQCMKHNTKPVTGDKDPIFVEISTYCAVDKDARSV